MTPDPQPQDHVFAGGLLSTDAHPMNEPAPLGFAAPGLHVSGEGNDDAASVFEDQGRWETTTEEEK